MTETEVLAYCGSCKMDLTAVVIARVGGKIVKVLCKTCKKERAYKPPKGVTEPGQAAAAASPAKKRSAKAAGSEAPKGVSIEAEWNRLMSEATQSRRVKYSPKTALSLGEVVEHPTFGAGVVTRIIHPDKAEILFQTDLKMLVHSKS